MIWCETKDGADLVKGTAILGGIRKPLAPKSRKLPWFSTTLDGGDLVVLGYHPTEQDARAAAEVAAKRFK